MSESFDWLIKTGKLQDLGFHREQSVAGNCKLLGALQLWQTSPPFWFFIYEKFIEKIANVSFTDLVLG